MAVDRRCGRVGAIRANCSSCLIFKGIYKRSIAIEKSSPVGRHSDGNNKAAFALIARAMTDSMSVEWNDTINKEVLKKEGVDEGEEKPLNCLLPFFFAPRTWAAIRRAVSWCFLAAAVFGWWYASPSSSYVGSKTMASLSLAIPAVSTEAVAVAVRSAWAGLAAGCLHTLAGADHLAALTPLTIGRTHFSASLLGALWGFGHSTGQLILGLLMVVLKDRFQQLVPALSKWGGTTVGLTLLAIGALGVYESFFEEHHDEDGEKSSLESNGKEDKKTFGLATFATGIIYGLQPDALFVIIPALALPTKLAAIAYILMFVFGTVAAMGAYAGLIGATSQAIQKTNSGLNANLSGAASAIAILIGFGILLPGWGIHLPWTRV
eukprot:jgi/Picsp_1/3712/NSC_06548-R1_at4g35080-like protein